MQPWRLFHDNSIIQYNGHHCGVFVCCAMEALSKNNWKEFNLKSLREYQFARLYLLSRLTVGAEL